MRSPLDEGISPLLAPELVAVGHDVTHVHEIGLTGASDSDVLGAAESEGRVLPPSRQPQTYDLSKRGDRIRVYEQVCREGTEEDIQRYIRRDELVDLFDELVLPPHLRDA